MKSRSLSGIAGVHFVVSELSRRGLVALPTVKNIAAYDILVANTEGTQHANVQVKASLRKVQFFPMPPSNKIRTGPRDVYVLVRWIKSDQRYQGFLLTGTEAKAAVESQVRAQLKRVREGTRKGTFPCVYVGPSNAEQAIRWEQAWRSWSI